MGVSFPGWSCCPREKPGMQVVSQSGEPAVGTQDAAPCGTLA